MYTIASSLRTEKLAVGSVVAAEPVLQSTANVKFGGTIAITIIDAAMPSP